METARSQSMMVVRHRGFVVYVHTEQSPTDDEWELAMAFCQGPDASNLRVLVYTHGAAPNAAQRARLREVLGNREVPMAVMTPSVLARAAGTAISWFNPAFRVFGPADYDSAFEHLRASADERTTLREIVERLKGELRIGTAQSAGAREG